MKIQFAKRDLVKIGLGTVVTTGVVILTVQAVKTFTPSDLGRFKSASVKLAGAAITIAVTAAVTKPLDELVDAYANGINYGIQRAKHKIESDDATEGVDQGNEGETDGN